MARNRHFSLLLLSVIGLAGAGASCHHKQKSYCEETPAECHNIQCVKDYFCFKQGSWWVYEEESSHLRDSVYVTASANNPANFDFDVRVYSTYQDYFYHYFPTYISVNGCSQNGAISTKCVLVNRSKYKPGELVGQGVCFFYNFAQGQSETTFNTAFPNNKISISEIDQAYTLGTLSFGPTVKIHELNTFVEDIQPTNHFYSLHVGLIRKELLDSNQVWNLVSYHIEP